MDVLFRDMAHKGESNRVLRAREKEIAKRLYAELTPRQQALVDDPSRSKAARCPRRAGKTFVAMRYALNTALTKPGSTVVIITLTLRSGKRLYWDELKQLNDDYKFGAKFHNTNLEIRLDNGSLIFLAGAETVAEVEKLRGGSYDLVIVDECKSFGPRIFAELIEEVIRPATMDRKGTILLIGTPGTHLKGPFYWATTHGVHSIEGSGGARSTWHTVQHGEEPMVPGRPATWSFHYWTLQDNTALPWLWEEALRIKVDNGWADDHPTWQIEYLGNWVAGESSLVSSYARMIGVLGKDGIPVVNWYPDRTSKNVFGLTDGIPWRYVLSCDLGYEDDFAMVIGAYSPHDGALRFVWDYKSPHLTVTQIAERILEAEEMVGTFDAIVGDAGGLGKMVLETLRIEHKIPIQPAKKKEKFDFVELMNTDIDEGRVKFVPGSDLAREHETVQYDLTKGTRSELAHRRALKISTETPDHLFDASLYAWRFCYHHWWTPAKANHAEYSPEWIEEWRKTEREAAGRRAMSDDWLSKHSRRR